jgi:hypothetical protein
MSKELVKILVICGEYNNRNDRDQLFELLNFYNINRDETMVHILGEKQDIRSLRNKTIDSKRKLYSAKDLDWFDVDYNILCCNQNIGIKYDIICFFHCPVIYSFGPFSHRDIIATLDFIKNHIEKNAKIIFSVSDFSQFEDNFKKDEIISLAEQFHSNKELFAQNIVKIKYSYDLINALCSLIFSESFNFQKIHEGIYKFIAIDSSVIENVHHKKFLKYLGKNGQLQ